MVKRFGMLAILALVAASPVVSQTETVFVEGFEENDASMTGGSVTFSMADEYTVVNIPALEGNWGLYTEYESTSSNSWSQATVNLPVPADLTGITELRFSL